MKKTTRGILIFPSELTERSVRQIIESGIETVGIHAAFSDNKEEDCVNYLIKRLQEPAFSALLNRLRSSGIIVEYELHAMNWLLPHNEFDAHPSWFPMDETGVRQCDFNLCPSNDAALAFVESRAEKLARLLPSSQSHRYFFWIDDNGSYCHCPKCRKLTPSDQAMRIYNSILKGIRKSDPLATQCYLAYQKTLPAPYTVVPLEGIFLEYAPIDRRSGFAINDGRCEENRKESQELDKLLRVFGSDRSQVLEYWLDISRFYSWKYPYGELPFYRQVIRQDAAFYRSLGFTHLTSFACRLMEDEYIDHYGEPPLSEYAELLK